MFIRIFLCQSPAITQGSDGDCHLRTDAPARAAARGCTRGRSGPRGGRRVSLERAGVGRRQPRAERGMCCLRGVWGRAPRAPAGGRRCVRTAVSSEALTGTFCSVLTGVLPAGGCLSVPQEITKVILTPDSPCGLSPPAGSSKPHRHRGKVRGWDVVPRGRHPPGASGPALWRPRRSATHGWDPLALRGASLP